MMEKKDFCCEAEREIDLMHLAFYMLRHWRSLIAVVIFGVLLGGVLCVVRTEPAAEMSPEQAVLSGAYVAPTEVQNRMKQAAWYRELYEKQAEYLQESYVMQMNGNKVYTGTVEYYLKAGNETRLLSKKFESVLKDEQLLLEIRRIVGKAKEAQYLQEILECSVEVSDSASNGSLAEDSAREAVVTYTVFFEERFTCNSILQAVQNKVGEAVEQYQTEYEIQRFEKINDYIEIRANSDFISRKKSNTDNANTYATSYTKIEGEFNGNPYDAAYYSIFYLEADTTGIEAFDYNAKVRIDIKTIIKWLVMGGILTAGIWGIFWVIRYLLDRSVRTAEELSRMYGLNILGNIVFENTDKNPVDRFITTWSRKYVMNSDSLEYLNDMVSSLGKGAVLVCGNVTNDTEQLFKEKILAGTGLQMMGFVHQDAEALQCAKKSGEEILIVQKGKTFYQEIKRELEISQMYAIHVLGVLVVE